MAQDERSFLRHSKKKKAIEGGTRKKRKFVVFSSNLQSKILKAFSNWQVYFTGEILSRLAGYFSKLIYNSSDTRPVKLFLLLIVLILVEVVQPDLVGLASKLGN